MLTLRTEYLVKYFITSTDRYIIKNPETKHKYLSMQQIISESCFIFFKNFNHFLCIPKKNNTLFSNTKQLLWNHKTHTQIQYVILCQKPAKKIFDSRISDIQIKIWLIFGMENWTNKSFMQKQKFQNWKKY